MAGQRNTKKKKKHVRGMPPDVLVCPITLDLMRDPVMDANGHTFERSAIERVLINRPGICPLTNAPYPNGDACLTPNRAVRDMVHATWSTRHGLRMFLKTAGEAACALAR
jgi:hypothetical protein